MESKTSFFNRTLFSGLLARFWPLWAAYAVAWIVEEPISLASSLNMRGVNVFGIVQSGMYTSALYFGTIITAIFAVLAAMAVFSFLYNSRSAGAIASLPVKRGSVFVSSFFAGFVCLEAVHVLTFLLILAVEAACGAVSVGPACAWLAITTMELVLFYGLAVLCAMLTGQILILPAVYAVFNFVVVAVEELVRYLLEQIVYGLSTNLYGVSAFSPIVCLLNTNVDYVWEETDGIRCAVGVSFDRWGLLAAYCAAGIVMSIAALLLMRKRRMETAGDIVAVRPLKPVFRYCMAGGCGLVAAAGFCAVTEGALLGSTLIRFLLMILVLVIGVFIGWFGAEMLMKKTFAVFRSSWRGYIVFAVIAAALCFACECDLFGYESRVPAQENVCMAYIGSSAQTNLTESGNIAELISIHSSIAAHKNVYENRAEAGGEYTRVYVPVRYYDSDSVIMERNYQLYVTEEEITDPNSDIGRLSALANTRDAIESRKKLSIPVEEEYVHDAYVSWWNGVDYSELPLTAEQACELYNDCIVPDMRDCAIGRVWLTDADYFDSAMQCSVSFNLVKPEQSGGNAVILPSGRQEYAAAEGLNYINEHFYTTPTVFSLRTNAYLEKLGVELYSVGECEKMQEK